MVNVYTKKGIVYIIHTFIFNEMSRLQYNVSIGCSTIWPKYGVIIGKLRMFISVAMEMEKLYSYFSSANYNIIAIVRMVSMIDITIAM